MSVDIILLKFERDLESLEDVGDDDALALGDPGSIRRAIEAAFGGVEWNGAADGLVIVREAFALEIKIPEVSTPTSLHVSLKPGSTWESDGDDEFQSNLGDLCRANHWQAFSVADNARVD